MPKLNFSYIASFQRNKVLVNNHVFLEGELGVAKMSKAAFIMDLTTMTKTEVPYGCVFANDYIIKNTKENGEYFFDWDTLEVLDKNFNVLHSIARKNKVPPLVYQTSELDHPNDIILLHVNQKSGENSIILSNLHLRDKSFEKHLDDFVDRKIILEVYDLKTASLILERKVEANRILAYYGNCVVMIRIEHIIAYDLHSKHETTLSADCKNPAVYINYDEIGLVENFKFKIFSLKELREIRTIDLESMFKSINHEGQIQALAFDDYKLVITYVLSGAIIHLVRSLQSRTLLTSMHTPYDRYLDPTVRPRVHVTPNGKIVTDALNLTVYDFAHPYVASNPELSIPTIYIKDSKVQATSIRLSELNKFAMEKLNVAFNLLRTRTITTSRNDRKFRATLLFCETGGPSEPLLSTLFSDWKLEENRRSAWQLTMTDPTQVTNGGFFASVFEGDRNNYHLSVHAAIIVFEEFNSKKNQWEFCEPCVDVEYTSSS